MKAERLRKFYEFIMADIKTCASSDSEKQELMARLNSYISMKASSVEHVASIISRVIASNNRKEALRKQN